MHYWPFSLLMCPVFCFYQMLSVFCFHHTFSVYCHNHTFSVYCHNVSVNILKKVLNFKIKLSVKIKTLRYRRCLRHLRYQFSPALGPGGARRGRPAPPRAVRGAQGDQALKVVTIRKAAKLVRGTFWKYQELFLKKRIIASFI